MLLAAILSGHAVLKWHRLHPLWHGCGRAFNSCPFDRVRVVIIGQARMPSCLTPGVRPFTAVARPLLHILTLQPRCCIGTLLCLIVQECLAGGGAYGHVHGQGVSCGPQTPDASAETCDFALLAQDPYHNDGQAMGLSFSVPPGQRVPSSLANMYKELADDCGCAPPNHGSLEKVGRTSVNILGSVRAMCMPVRPGPSSVLFGILTSTWSTSGLLRARGADACARRIKHTELVASSQRQRFGPAVAPFVLGCGNPTALALYELLFARQPGERAGCCAP